MAFMAELTYQNMVNVAPLWPVQLTLLVIQAIVWFLLIPLIGLKIVKPIFLKQDGSQRFGELWKATLKEGYGVNLPFEQSYDFGCLMIGIAAQHVVGGLLCLPAVLHMSSVSASAAASMARMGALCEAGWELQDGLYRAYQVLFTADGKVTNPPSLLIIFAIHHAMGLSLVLPMNIYFSDCYWYFYLVLLLQLAAAVALSIQSVGYLIDITTAAGLCKMKVSVTIVFLIMWWSRGLAYVHVIYEVLYTFWSSDAMKFFGMGCIVAVAMGLLNMLFIVDATVKFKKFITMKAISEGDKAKKEKVRRLSLDAFAQPAMNPTAEGSVVPESTKKAVRRLTGQMGGETGTPLLNA